MEYELSTLKQIRKIIFILSCSKLHRVLKHGKFYGKLCFILAKFVVTYMIILSISIPISLVLKY